MQYRVRMRKISFFQVVALALFLVVGCSRPEEKNDIVYLGAQEDGRAFQEERADVAAPPPKNSLPQAKLPETRVKVDRPLKKEQAAVKKTKKGVLPSSFDARRKRLTIVLDPGHGGFDFGAQKKGSDEKDLNLKTALAVRKILANMGYTVVMTRARDEYISLQKRAEIANKAKSQLLVSIHYNAAASEEANGIEIFCPSKAESWRLKRSKQLAQKALAKLIGATDANSRGVKEANFCVIREARMPSILIECGFITNEKERKLINSEVYQNKIAESIAEAIHQYFSETTAAIY